MKDKLGKRYETTEVCKLKCDFIKDLTLLFMDF